MCALSPLELRVTVVGVITSPRATDFVTSKMLHKGKRSDIMRVSERGSYRVGSDCLLRRCLSLTD